MTHEWDLKFEEILRTMLTLPADAPITHVMDLTTAGIDSLAIVELMLQVEEGYAISFPDELLTRETFATPASLWEAVVALSYTQADSREWLSRF